MIFMDLKGTTNQTFQIQKGGAKIKNAAGEIAIVAADGTTPANLIADILKATADYVVLNSNAAGAGADWLYNIKRPAVGMTADVDFILPPNFGSNTNVLTTDGAGNLTWASPSIPSAVQCDVTDLIAASVSPVAMFTLPANSIVDEVKVIIDTAFDGAPTLKVGLVGTLNKYLDVTDVDLTSGDGDAWAAHKNPVAPLVAEALIATYVAGGAVNGISRILTKYVIPS
jgi:hypothetical protein